MDRCASIGMNGNCGINCPVLHDFECPIHEEMIEILLEQGLKVELADWELIEDADPFDAFDDAMEILK